ncbi:MAG: DNA alkylation repair protein [Candidatus Marinimicrobia bacterium]|jgi:3-methyladenine DNA glycosylase AlkD|nr:DNA alkylation repair protein [Candidatus Neomarinimicrobiota bacterium]MBT3632979.1 DNA alkylation repair protein [Candidatus Neomarinimicrobiota bacterium]MBT3682089.1 DNA alkylation repair protein [Candidatus Neomarinimicrobiota bacterium]MBT3758882.1 DNA alkylation repair protein [Candidatus Neomarinimicrobiota bacterium]MBT3895219.1 DNA alkylation repair protein [Candidatus Neomarinimicrobiota bacterium]
MKIKTHDHYGDLTRKLFLMMDELSLEKTRNWWQKYMKYVIEFRGIGIPQIRALLVNWRNDCKIYDMTYADQYDIALSLFTGEKAEDKLAGILYIENYLVDRVDWKDLYNGYENIYDRHLIFDWNICDWFCVRVLGSTLKKYGKEFGVALSKWKDDEYLWKARSSVVPFIKVAKEAHYYPIIENNCQTLIKRDERFAKTSVGWLLREISKHDAVFVTSFINTNISKFTVETIKNATKYLNDDRQKFLTKLKHLQS